MDTHFAERAHVQIKPIGGTNKLTRDRFQLHIEIQRRALSDRGSNVQDDDVARVISHVLRQVHCHEDNWPQTNGLLVAKRAHAICAHDAHEADVPICEVLRMIGSDLNTHATKKMKKKIEWKYQGRTAQHRTQAYMCDYTSGACDWFVSMSAPH
jgi:hypothetical protein